MASVFSLELSGAMNAFDLHESHRQKSDGKYSQRDQNLDNGESA
jgi:hypothetical protein